MRINGIGRMPVGRWAAATVAAAGLALAAGGCASSATSDAKLKDGYRQLESPRPDAGAMLSAADAYLAEQPEGKGVAEAWYLRGRAYEERFQQDVATADKDLAAAYGAYTEAAKHPAAPAVEGLIHRGLGNVLYFQGQYARAIAELTRGLEVVERDADRAWAMYRIGLCQHRLGQWEQGDRTFAQVRQQFPGSEQARRAAEHAGQRGFWVEVGAYAGPAQADAAVADLRRVGIPAAKFADASRPAVQLVRVGPMTTYDQASAVRQRVAGRYTTATIVP